MAKYRRLDFECMEQRLALASDFANSTPTNEISLPLVFEPMVQFRVEAYDAQGQVAMQLTPHENYVARVFAMDLRSLADADGNRGGVFQANLDLVFSENATPVGGVTFGPDFNRFSAHGSLDGTHIRNVNATINSLVPVGQNEQYLFETPFQVQANPTLTSIRVVPSGATDEAVLLFNQSEPLSDLVIREGSWGIPGIDVATPPVTAPFVAAVEEITPVPTLVSRSDVPTQNQIWGTVSVTSEPFWMTNRREPIGLESARIIDAGDDEDRSDAMNVEEDQPAVPGRRNQDKRASEADDVSDDGVAMLDDSGVEESIGLFYHENLFLEGAFSEPASSPFRLRFQIYPLDGSVADDADTMPPAMATAQPTTPGDSGQQDSSEDPAFVDIAPILRPHRRETQWMTPRDAIVAGRATPATQRWNSMSLGMTMSFDIVHRAAIDRRESERPPASSRPMVAQTTTDAVVQELQRDPNSI